MAAKNTPKTTGMGLDMEPTAEGLDAATLERLLDLVAREGMIEREHLVADAAFEDLGIQSADMVVILMAIEEEFGVYIPVDGDLAEARTLGDFMKVLAAGVLGDPGVSPVRPVAFDLFQIRQLPQVDHGI